MSTEDVNGLQSHQYANVIDLICEGPIQGLVGGLKGVYLNNTPVMDNSGNYNFTGVNSTGTTVNAITLLPAGSITTGTATQAPQYNSAPTGAVVSVGTKVYYGIPQTAHIVASGATRVAVIMQVPSLNNTDTGSGDIHGNTVVVRISLSTAGGAYVVQYDATTGTPLTGTITGKCMSEYDRQYIVNLPTAAYWDLKVERMTLDSVSAYDVKDLYWKSYTVAVDAPLSYPYSAVSYINIDSQFFQSIPTRGYHIQGLLVKIPSNYNPTTRVYSGTWDGSFTTAYSNNPAWCFYDLITNTRYGLGNYISAAQVDKWSLYTIAQYCDAGIVCDSTGARVSGGIPDGLGNYEPRFTCNLYLQSAAEAYKVLANMASVFRGMAFWLQGQISATQDSPANPSAIFTPANVIGGAFTYSSTAMKARHTVALVTWNDPAAMYQQRVEYVEDAVGIAKYGVQSIAVTAFGCTSRGQAHRFGLWTLYTERLETETVVFRTGMEHVNILPGLIIETSDPTRAGVRLGGRVTAATSTSVSPDATINLLAGKTYTLSCVLPSGAVESYPVTNASGTSVSTSVPITVSGGFSVAPQVMGMFVLAQNDLVPEQWRVLSIVESDKLVAEITAISHNPGKYALVELGTPLQTLQTSQGVPTVPAVPTNLVAVEGTYISASGTKSSKVSLGWTGGSSMYVVTGTNLTKGSNPVLQTVTSPSVDFLAVLAGDIWQFAVQATNVLGVSSKQAVITYTVIGNTAAASAVSGFTAVSNETDIILSWTACPDSDYLDTTIKYGTSFAAGTTIFQATANVFSWSRPASGSYTFWAEHRNTSGNFSATATSTTLAYTLPPILNSAVTLTGLQGTLAANQFSSTIEPVGLVTSVPSVLSTHNVFNTTNGQMYTWNGTAYVVLTANPVAGSISATSFASGIEPVSLVSSIPGAKTTYSVFNTTDGKLYRWSGTAYVSTVASTDLTGTVSDAQIAGLAASKVTGSLTASQIASVNAAAVGVGLTASQIASVNAAAVGTGLTGTQIAAGTITGGNIAATTITAANIVGSTITAGQIAAATITGTQIAGTTITAANIVADTITAGQIAANAITSSELAAGAVIAGKITAGTIVAGDIAAGTITGDRLLANTITAGQIAAGAISASQIAAGGITANNMAITPTASNNQWIDANFTDTRNWQQCSWGAFPTQGTVTDGVAGGTTLRGGIGGASAFGLFRVPVTVGNKYKVSCQARNVGGNGTLYLRVDCSTSRSGSYGQIAGTVEGVSPAAAWALYSWVWTATSPWASPMVLVNYGGSSGYQEAQDVRIEELIGGDLIVAGSVTADRLVANSITAGQIAAGAISATQISATAGITAGQINSRGLSIYAADGSLILGAGTGLTLQNQINPYTSGATANQSDATTNAAITVAGTTAIYSNLSGTPSSAIANSAVSISAGGALSGAGGGSVTIGGLGYTGALNATAGKSLGLPLSSWGNLAGFSIVTLSDGKVGSTALRMTTTSFPNQGNFTPIDYSKTYRTRFWARSVPSTNGNLYFSLRQFIDGAGAAAGPSNGGRNPYKPAGLGRSAATDSWTEYSYLWTSADWQTGVQYVQPEFLGNYNGSTGYWEVQDFTFEEVTEAVTAQATAVASASTAIWGGIGSVPSNIATAGASPSVSVLNSNITVSSGVLSGIGTSGIVVDNSIVAGTAAADATSKANAAIAATTSINLFQAQGTGQIVTGNSIGWNGAGGSWTTVTATVNGYSGGAYCSFSLPSAGAYFIAGLTNSPTGTTITSIPWGIIMRGDNTIVARYLSGGSETEVGIAIWSAGCVISIAYDGPNTRYFVNGVLELTVAATTGQTYYFAASPISTGAGLLANVQFGPMSSNAWAAIGGSNKPADNATQNQSDTITNTSISAAQAAAINSAASTGVQTSLSNAPAGILNTSITIDGNGALNGVGTGSGVVVNNNVDSNGVLHIARPVGGTAGVSSTVTGALKIRLPQGFTNTMLRFSVDIYEYGVSGVSTYDLGGYTYTSQRWDNNPFARYSGPPSGTRTVRLGMDGSGYACAWIGEWNTTWYYPQVLVRDFVAGYSNYSESQWATGWGVTWDTGGALNISYTNANPVSGGTLSGLNAADWSSNVTGSGKPADNATANQSDTAANNTAAGYASAARSGAYTDATNWSSTDATNKANTAQSNAQYYSVQTNLSNAPSAILNSAVNLSTLGAGAFATLSTITSANASSYIASSAIGTAQMGAGRGMNLRTLAPPPCPCT